MYNLLRLAVLVVSVKDAAAGPLRFDTRSAWPWKHERSAAAGGAEVHAEKAVSSAIVFTNLKGAPVATESATTIADSTSTSSTSPLPIIIVSTSSLSTSSLPTSSTSTPPLPYIPTLSTAAVSYTSTLSTPSPFTSGASASSSSTGSLQTVKPFASLTGSNAATATISSASATGVPTESTTEAFAQSSTLAPTTLTITVSTTSPFATFVSAASSEEDSNSGTQTQSLISTTTSYSRLYTLTDGASTTVSFAVLPTGFVIPATISTTASSRALGIFPTGGMPAVPGSTTAMGSLQPSESATTLSGTAPESSAVPTLQSNLAMALQLNSLFTTLKANSTCNPNHPVERASCIEGKVALCGPSGKYLFLQCPPGTQCFALPKEAAGQGVDINCDTPADAVLRLGQSSGDGSNLGGGTSSATTTTADFAPTSSGALPSATAGTSLSSAGGGETTVTASSDSPSFTTSTNPLISSTPISSLAQLASPSTSSPFSEKGSLPSTVPTLTTASPSQSTSINSPTISSSSDLPVQTAPGENGIALTTTIISTAKVTMTIHLTPTHKRHSTTPIAFSTSTTSTMSTTSGAYFSPMVNVVTLWRTETAKVTETVKTTVTDTATVTHTVTATADGGGAHRGTGGN